MKALRLVLIAGLTVSTACKPKDQPAAGSQTGMPVDSSRMRGMSGMSGKSGMSGMMPMMQGQMDSMLRMNPAQMSQMMASHQQMMSQMLDQMDGEMGQMKTSGTPEWTALRDSVRQDLADLPGLKGQALSTRMRAHADRVRRLMASHRQMMK